MPIASTAHKIFTMELQADIQLAPKRERQKHTRPSYYSSVPTDTYVYTRRPSIFDLCKSPASVLQTPPFLS